jgi:hypothetical protein
MKDFGVSSALNCVLVENDPGKIQGITQTKPLTHTSSEARIRHLF